MLIDCNTDFFNNDFKQSLRNFTSGMKRNLFIHIPTLLLVLVFSAFSLSRLQAGVQKFTPSLYSEITQQQTKSVHTPDGGYNSSEENVVEKETEDESETEFNAALPILSLSQNFSAILFSVQSFNVYSSNEDSKKTQDPLYLVVRSIRIWW